MKLHQSIIAALVLLIAPMAHAAVSDEQFAQMQAQFAELAQRLNALEAENAKLREINQQTIREVELTSAQVAEVAKKPAASSWTDTVRIKGDFRYRYEAIDVEDVTKRERNRVRARAAIVADLPNNVEVGLGMASGGSDPVSTNQTLGGGGSTKDLRMDLAYFNWAATKDLNVIGGKHKNTMYRPQKHGLIYDGDYRPEGFNIQYTPGSFFLTVGGTWLESDTKLDNSEFTWSGQLGFNGNIGSAKLVTGLGYQQIDTAGKTPFFGDPSDFFGNTFVCDDPVALEGCSFLYDYHTVQAFADLGLTVGDMPLGLFFDYVHNTEADEFDTGYAVGARLGKTSGWKTWDIAYNYQDLEADATLGLLTDSDFGGGGIDGKGHVFKAGFGINKKWSLGLTYFKNEIGGNKGLDTDFDRIMLDTKFKY